MQHIRYRMRFHHSGSCPGVAKIDYKFDCHMPLDTLLHSLPHHMRMTRLGMKRSDSTEKPLRPLFAVLIFLFRAVFLEEEILSIQPAKEGEEEEEIHYVHTASKGLSGRICHAVWASSTMANIRAQTDAWHHEDPGKSLHAEGPGNEGNHGSFMMHRHSGARRR